MKRKILLITLCIMFTIFTGCYTTNSQFEYHQENLTTLTNVTNSDSAETMLLALESSGAITQYTKLVEADIIKKDENNIELYAGLMVHFYIENSIIKLYTFETTFSEDSAILLYDSSQEAPIRILSETERSSLISSQRKYIVQTTIKISPSTGILLHSLYGSSNISLKFTNRSDTKIDNVYLVITPCIIGGGTFESKNRSYTMIDPISINGSISKTLTVSGWNQYDTYKITKAVITFSDGTAISFNAFDCQFLNE